MKSPLSSQLWRGNAPARILWFSAQAPVGAGCAGTAKTGKRRLSMTKANASTKLGITFEDDCHVAEPIPVLARPARHFEWGARRDQAPCLRVAFPASPGWKQKYSPSSQLRPGCRSWRNQQEKGMKVYEYH